MKFLSDEGEEINELVQVDLNDTSVSLPKELAQTIIAIRDKSKTETNSLKLKLDEVVKQTELSKQEIQKTQKEKEQLELMKNGELNALKESLASEWQEKTNALENEKTELLSKIVDSEIKSTIASVENVNKDAIDDIFLRLKSQNPTLVENTIKVGDDDLASAVKKVVDSKDYFRVVKSPVGTGSSVTPVIPSKTDTRSLMERILSDIQK